MSASTAPPPVPPDADGATGSKGANVGEPSIVRFEDDVPEPSPSRAAIGATHRRPEPDSVAALIDAATLPPDQAASTHALAARLAGQLRSRKVTSGREGLVQGLIQEFALSSQEGVALMCLAEALLRIPDAATRDALIRDKIGAADWQAHLGRSPSVFVNAATWGLLLTGKLVATHTEQGLASALTRLLARSGEPVVRRGVDMAMRLMGEQFVTGETIEEALLRAKRREREGFRYSYDMLGEAALTAADAQRYLAAYRHAIDAIGQASAGRGIHEGPGISIKLSALHPRYVRAQRPRVLDELYPCLRELATLAREHDIGLNIDAEEAERLDLSLDLLELLCAEPALDGWHGIGFVVQAYQKRCGAVLAHLIGLARRSRHRLMIRLVKGAYWDSEIKRAQVDGLDDYPVFTRKAHTDVSYLAAARRLLGAPDAVYPQFATHNAHTLAAIATLAGADAEPSRYEFQCLHGMGEPLYAEVVAPRAAGGLGRPCRIYAPVGTHETLLAYLVRRLLENGANTSFVNRIADPDVDIDALVADPVDMVRAVARETGVLGAPHPAIVRPPELYRPVRRNSSGLDLSNEAVLASLGRALQDGATTAWRAAPEVAGPAREAGAEQAVRDPSDRRRVVGTVVEASPADVAAALDAAARATWHAVPATARAAALERAADRMQEQMPALIGLAIHEAGKTAANAIGEVREAIDFLRYYAAQARAAWGGAPGGAGPAPLGIVVCISPWNFPLAIFTGQVAAALVAGNAVIAKPAEQTPLIAAEAVRLLHEAGVPGDALQFLPGRGETVGAALVADARVRGVLFTGSNDVARLLQRALAGRVDAQANPATLIAETGGQNAMIVDSSALIEQVVADVVTSAFDSAGQRCSALRVLCVQDDIAERTIEMLLGAMRELRLGPPARLATDVGPVIDDEALAAIERHVDALQRAGRRVHRPVPVDPAALAHGSFVAPALIELEHLGELTREVFGPVLHVLRYRRAELGALVDQINATGYGLTLGIHTRIDETIEFVAGRVRAGNHYVNRNMVGAVVGVQPFGGEGLSGTGPKAGGPLYLPRLCRRNDADERVAASAPAGVGLEPKTTGPRSGSIAPDRAAVAPAISDRREDAALADPAARALCDWLSARPADTGLAVRCRRRIARRPPTGPEVLPGPTGERNTYSLVPRSLVLCLGDSRADLLEQVAVVLAAGARAAWLTGAEAARWTAELPGAVRERLAGVADPLVAPIDAALIEASAERVAGWHRRLAERAGPIVALHVLPADGSPFELERLQVERSLSVNTAAAGGNASLMTIG
jgi:RHH-type proline utilization regulon transcriptional repressor/proline dehydrogenase/delta 1-pyrroline-5-carboxylate dehydrogenase